MIHSPTIIESKESFMGLTIHYGLSTDRTEVSAIRSLVQEIRQLASGLPFQEVGEIVEFQGKACGFEDRDDPHRWLKIQAGRYVEGGGYSNKVSPLHIVAFTTVPGDGSEPANIGFCRFPRSIDIERPRKQRLRTNLHGWTWSSFCKTQYASDPSCGGTPNFVRCHLSIVGLLDAIQKRQLAKVEVSDESDYWEHRDVRKLAETVGEWNELIAAVVGQFKDGPLGTSMEAPITQFANFEHLEAKGRDKFSKPSA
jgi:hypothetical protein